MPKVAVSVVIVVLAIGSSCVSENWNETKIAVVRRDESWIDISVQDAKMKIKIEDLAQVLRDLTGWGVVVEDDVPKFLVFPSQVIGIECKEFRIWLSAVLVGTGIVVTENRATSTFKIFKPHPPDRGSAGYRP